VAAWAKRHKPILNSHFLPVKLGHSGGLAGLKKREYGIRQGRRLADRA
jgi:hypothetical protein